MQNKFINTFIIVFYVMFGTFISANSTLLLDSEQLRYEKFQLEYFEDLSEEPLAFDVIMKQNFEKTSNAFSFGYKKHNFWFRIEVENNNNVEKKIFLEITEAIHKNVDLYVVSEYDHQLKEKNGLSIPVEERPLTYANPTFSLDFLPHEKKSIYVNLSSIYGIFGSFVLKTPQAFYSDHHLQDNLYMFYFGAILMIGLYNLFIFLYLREKVYLYYVSYVFIFAVWVANYKGLLLPYSSMGVYNILQVTIPLFFTMLALFSQKVLETKKYFSSCHKMLNLFIVVLMLSLVWMLIDMHTGFYVMTIAAAPFLPFLLIVAGWALHKGHKIAKIYLFALTIYLLSMILLSMMALGILPYSLGLSSAPIIGSFFEIVLLSLLLAYRINKLRQSKVRSQERLLAFQSTQKEHLTQKVEEKTHELRNVNNRLNMELEAKEKLQEILILEAKTDDLTGILNRRAFFGTCMKELESSKRYKHALSFLIIDIDFFKNINDQYGHLNGDIVLKDMVEAVNQSIRATDVFGRIGGEEFAVLMPETNLEDAMYLAERIRNNVFEKVSLLDAKEVSISVSIGLSLLREDDSMIQTMLRRADMALFKAKDNGRNQVCTEEDLAA